MSDILYDENINSLNNGSSKQEVEKEENDDDDDDDGQLSDEIDQSLGNYDDIGPHTNSKLVKIANKAFSRLVYGGKWYFQTNKGLSEGRGAHESWCQEKKR